MKLVVKDDGGKDGDYYDTPAVAERVWTASASEWEEITLQKGNINGISGYLYYIFSLMFLFKKHYGQPAVAALILEMFTGWYSFQLFYHSFVNS